MKHLWIAVIGLILTFSSMAYSENNEEQEAYYSHCFGIDNNFNGFQSCVNSNFRTASNEFNMYLSYCVGTNYSLESCINNNFSQLRNKVGIYFSHCFGIDTNPYGFESCVNNNFRSLSRIMAEYSN